MLVGSIYKWKPNEVWIYWGGGGGLCVNGVGNVCGNTSHHTIIDLVADHLFVILC